MIYILIGIDADGRARWAWTQNPQVPPGFCSPGGVAFVVRPLDSVARHFHDDGEDQ